MAKFGAFKFAARKFGASLVQPVGSQPWASWGWEARKGHRQAFDVFVYRGLPIDPKPGHCTTNVINDDTRPIAVPDVHPISLFTNEYIRYDAARSYDPDSNVALTYLWDFGGAGNSTQEQGSWAWSSAGEKEVTLKVTDGVGVSSQTSVFVDVHNPSNPPPTAPQEDPGDPTNDPDEPTLIAGIWDGSIYVATKSHGIYRTQNGGLRWTAQNGQYAPLSGDALSIRGIAVTRWDQPNRDLWIATAGGIKYLNGYTIEWGGWQSKTMGNPTNSAGDSPAPVEANVDFMDIDYHPTPRLFEKFHAIGKLKGATGGDIRGWVYRWTRPGTTLPVNVQLQNDAGDFFAYQPISVSVTGSYVYVTAQDDSGNFHLFRSNANGTSYTLLQSYSGGTNMRVYAWKTSWGDNDIVILYGYFGGYQLLYSSTSGATFSDLSLSDWGTSEAIFLNMDQVSPPPYNLVVAINGLRRIYQSKNQGRSWTLMGGMTADIETGVRLYEEQRGIGGLQIDEFLIGHKTAGQVWYSTNAGESVQPRHTGLPASGIVAFTRMNHA